MPIHGPRGYSVLRYYLPHLQLLHYLLLHLRRRRRCVSVGLRSSLHSVNNDRSLKTLLFYSCFSGPRAWKTKWLLFEEGIFGEGWYDAVAYVEITNRDGKVGRLIRGVHCPSHLRVHVPREHAPTHSDRVSVGFACSSRRKRHPRRVNSREYSRSKYSIKLPGGITITVSSSRSGFYNYLFIYFFFFFRYR